MVVAILVSIGVMFIVGVFLQIAILVWGFLKLRSIWKKSKKVNHA